MTAFRLARRALAFLCCASPLLLVTAGRKPDLGEKYPVWFLHSPPGARSAVGYAPTYGDTGAAIQEALDYATGALRLASHVRVTAEYLQEILPNGQVAYRGEQYTEDTLATGISTVLPVDTVFMRRMVLLLVSTGGVGPLGRRVSLPDTAPAWIRYTPARDDGVYAVGVASARFNEYESWKEAERQARRSLAFSSATGMRSLVQSEAGAGTSGAIVASSVAEFRDVEVRERWRDARRLFVLVHATVIAASGNSQQ